MIDWKYRELRALAEAATPGPWEAYFTRHGDPIVIEAGKGVFDALTDPIVRPSTAPADYGRANCQFIGAANPAVVILLLDEIENMRRFMSRRQHNDGLGYRTELEVYSETTVYDEEGAACIRTRYIADTMAIKPGQNVTLIPLEQRMRHAYSMWSDAMIKRACTPTDAEMNGVDTSALDPVPSQSNGAE